MKVLIVEDSQKLRRALVTGLRSCGMVVDEAGDGPSGFAIAWAQPPDAIVLDQSLPGFDGVELLRRLREVGVTAPTLMLTAHSALHERLRAFDVGADDFVAKPVDILELAARLRALARRSGGVAKPTVVLDDIELDLARGELRRDGQALPIRRRELALLELLTLRRGQVVERDRIERSLFRDALDLRSNSIESAISQLRRHIDRPGEPSRITTLRGVGYRLER